MRVRLLATVVLPITGRWLEWSLWLDRHGDRGYRLLTVERDPEEGRRFLVRLSPKGRQLLKQLERL